MTKDEIDKLYYDTCKANGYSGAAQLPLNVLQNWITRESGYRYDVVSSIGERGFMQVGKSWASDRGITGDRFAAVSASPASSMAVSCRMVQETFDLVTKRLRAANVALSGADFWWAVKLYHALPNLFNGVLKSDLFVGAPAQLQRSPHSAADLRARGEWLGKLGPGSWMDRRKRGGLDHRRAVERVLKNADASAYGPGRPGARVPQSVPDNGLDKLLAIGDAERSGSTESDDALATLLKVQ